MEKLNDIFLMSMEINGQKLQVYEKILCKDEKKYLNRLFYIVHGKEIINVYEPKKWIFEDFIIDIGAKKIDVINFSGIYPLKIDDVHFKICMDCIEFSNWWDFLENYYPLNH